MNISIPYLSNEKLDIDEQAAGFAPFTKGYNCYGSKPKIITNDSNLIIDFYIINNTTESILSIFKTIISQENLKPTYHILIELPASSNLIATTQVLRTLLSFLCLSKTKNAKASKFYFYLRNKHSKKIALQYTYATMAQIDVLVTQNLGASILQSIPQNTVPIDPMYGSDTLKKQTHLLFFNVWNKIKEHFIL